MTAVRQLVPKPRSGDIKRSVAQTSSGPRYDACDGPRRAETATGLSSGADLHVSERYNSAQPCSDLKHQCSQFVVDTASNRQPV